MPTISTITKEGCFDHDVASQINTNLANLNAASGIATVATTGPNYIASETGANNAIVGTFSGAPSLVAGLLVYILLAHTLQAGANTFAYGGGAAKNIKSHLAVANNIATAYAVGSIVSLIYDGTSWQDLSQ